MCPPRPYLDNTRGARFREELPGKPLFPNIPPTPFGRCENGFRGQSLLSMGGVLVPKIMALNFIKGPPN